MSYNIQSVELYCKMAKKVDILHRMDFNALSVQFIPNFKGSFQECRPPGVTSRQANPY